MAYRKSYRGLIVWLVAFFACAAAVMLLPARQEDLLARVWLNVCALGIAALSLIIWRSGAVYWYNEKRLPFGRRLILLCSYSAV